MIYAGSISTVKVSMTRAFSFWSATSTLRMLLIAGRLLVSYIRRLVICARCSKLVDCRLVRLLTASVLF